MRRENILQSLSSWNNTIRLLHVDSPFVGDLFLLRLDPVKKALSVRAYGKELLPEAQKAYEQMEKETEGEPNTQVVLVAVEDLDSLRKAYPNYYVDTSGFIAAVEAEIGKTNEQPVPQEPEQRDLPLSEVSE
jgi:putative GTP pyrophosphokinase